ncbi:cysteine desulfurase family protein [uncultured Roseobacter sp.]|uniref:cysteine desulfurase family protein n=1 Tax=uncultured Roseobacter sp. TaxID=114847 RepID=UPI002614A29F|nr:cysteine desulfurase family protein [uncultured Roseobacter sp.]
MGRVYLDHNATAPLRPEARDAMIAAMDVVGNPSSVHGEGRAAKALVERARMQVAELVGCSPGEVVFTSGATEAAGLAIPESATVSSAGIEHDAVLSWVQRDGVDLTHLLDVDADGVLTGTAQGAGFENKIWDDVVALQAANSETGVLQDTMPHAQALRALKRDVLVLVDAVQALGKVPFSFARSGADLVMASAHKLGGPKGVGALIVKHGLDVTARIRGGGQEMGRRSGTENVIGIAGFGAAAEAATRDVAEGRWDGVEKLRKILENTLAGEAKETIFVGKGANRLPNTSCFATPGWKGETQVMQMDLAGFAVSAGSACSSGKVRASTVLRALGYDDETASSAIRVSLGLETTEQDVLRFADAWLAQERKFRARAA